MGAWGQLAKAPQSSKIGVTFVWLWDSMEMKNITKVNSDKVFTTPELCQGKLLLCFLWVCLCNPTLPLVLGAHAVSHHCVSRPVGLHLKHPKPLHNSDSHPLCPNVFMPSNSSGENNLGWNLWSDFQIFYTCVCYHYYLFNLEIQLRLKLQIFSVLTHIGSDLQSDNGARWVITQYTSM